MTHWNARGYGYITPAGGGDAMYAHASSLRDGMRELKVGMLVKYKSDKGHGKGPMI